jgi:hypothetical protein
MFHKRTRSICFEVHQLSFVRLAVLSVIASSSVCLGYSLEFSLDGMIKGYA